MQGTLFAKLCANERLYEATESGWMSVSVGKREWFSFGRTEELTMIVEERGIPVWTRVRFPPGPSPKKYRNCEFENEIHYYGIFIQK